MEMTLSLKHIKWFNFTWVLKLLTSHKCHCSHLVQFVTQTTPTFWRAFNSYSSWLIVTPTDWEESFTARNGGPTWPECCFLSPFVLRRREIANQGLVQLYLEADTLSWLSAETHPPPPVLLSLLAQNLSPKDISKSIITSWKLYDGYICVSTAIKWLIDVVVGSWSGMIWSLGTEHWQAYGCGCKQLIYTVSTHESYNWKPIRSSTLQLKLYLAARHCNVVTN